MNVGLHDRTARPRADPTTVGRPAAGAHPRRRGGRHAGRGPAGHRRVAARRGRGAATGDGRCRSADPAAARAWCHRRAGERADPGLGGSRATAWSRPTSASPTTARSGGWPSGWPRRPVDGSMTPRRSSTRGCRTAPACTPRSPPRPCRAPVSRSAFRRGGRSRWSDCIATGAVSPSLAAVLARLVESRAAFLVSGGTGSGKTTLLAALLALVPPGERMVVVEDSRELRPDHPHVVSLEGRPANAEGRGAIALTDLVRQSLRMRPDRLIVGEVRGAEICDLLAAMNTGHEGRLRHRARQLGGGRPGPARGARRPRPPRPAGAARPAGVGARRGGAHPSRSGRAAPGQRAARAGARPGDGLGRARYRRWTAPARGPGSGPGAASARDGSSTDDRAWRSPARVSRSGCGWRRLIPYDVDSFPRPITCPGSRGPWVRQLALDGRLAGRGRPARRCWRVRRPPQSGWPG